MFWNRLGYSPLCIEETQGRAGGIWALAQNGHNFALSTFHSNSQSVTIEVRMGTHSWYCTGVYASPTPTCRDSFWQYLIDLSTTISGAWTLIGDFNEILLPCEQKGCHFSMSTADLFSDVLQQCGLFHLHTTGGKFTWHRHCVGYHHMAKRLDRGIANLDWRLVFPEAFVEVLCILHSNHNPLLLRVGGLPQVRGSRPFRFEAAWITHQDYQSIVHGAWRENTGSPVESLANVREKSIIFNKEVFGDIFRRKRAIEVRLNGIQKTLERVDSLALIHLEQPCFIPRRTIVVSEVQGAVGKIGG